MILSLFSWWCSFWYSFDADLDLHTAPHFASLIFCHCSFFQQFRCISCDIIDLFFLYFPLTTSTCFLWQHLIVSLSRFHPSVSWWLSSLNNFSFDSIHIFLWASSIYYCCIFFNSIDLFLWVASIYFYCVFFQ